MAERRTKTTVTLTPDQLLKLDILSDRLLVNRSYLIRQAIQEYLNDIFNTDDLYSDSEEYFKQVHSTPQTNPYSNPYAQNKHGYR